MLPVTRKALKYFMKLITPEYISCYLVAVFFQILCYITNPIVVLFCDKYGNLPRVFRLWQTYDNCLDVEWMISEEVVPKIFRYDFNKHYRYYSEVKTNDDFVPGHVALLDDDFTIKERVQRYFCRLLWLYRNTAYGFAYNILGITYTGTDQHVLEHDSSKGKEIFVSFIEDPCGIDRYFCIKSAEYWKVPFMDKQFRFDIYIGWKLSGTQDYTNQKRAMIAIRINPFLSVK